MWVKAHYIQSYITTTLSWFHMTIITVHNYIPHVHLHGIITQLGHNMLLMTFTCTYEANCVHEHKAQCQCSIHICIVGMVDGCGYDSQPKYTICDTCRPCHSILSILKPVFRWIQQIGCAYRCLDLQIWWFLWLWRQNQWSTLVQNPRRTALAVANLVSSS